MAEEEKLFQSEKQDLRDMVITTMSRLIDEAYLSNLKDKV